MSRPRDKREIGFINHIEKYDCGNKKLSTIQVVDVAACDAAYDSSFLMIR
jgi:hypothetical protein